MRVLCSALLLALTAFPAAAFDQMTRASCQESFSRLAELADPDSPELGLQIQYVRVTNDSWCQIRGGDPGFESAEFTTLEWRSEETALWTDEGVPPMAVQLRISGLDPDEMQGQSQGSNRPDVRVEATLRQEPDAGLVIVERAVMENDAGDSLAVSGVFERMYLSSPSMMQVSLGSAAFKAGLMTMTLDGTHENPFGFYVDVEVRGLPGAQRQAAFDIISNLPDGVANDASRAELTAFAGDLPRPVGKLEISVSSERGLGLMQVGMSVYSSVASIMEEDGQNNQMEILLDGVTVNANWSPRAQVAD